MNEAAVTQCISSVLTQCGLELDRIEFFAAGRQRIVRVHVDGDGPEGRGPTLDEIADATKEISRALDELAATGERPYTLEVSSRGVTRPLTEAKHFRRNTGRLVEVRLGDETMIGRIAATDDDTVTLTIDDDETVVPLAKIESAVVQIEMR